jgi:hypothetical protein
MHTSLKSRVLSRSVVTELLLLAGVLAAAFAYLDVPLWNALLFSVAVVSQAAFGTVILTRILKGVPASLLLLLGPGLILGGALSFALFQIVARGVIGLVVVIMVGAASVVYLLRTPNWQLLGSERLWILGQVVGLAALALTWEFPELLPVAVAFFVLGFITGDMFTTPRWVKQIAVSVAAVVVITPLFFRQDFWWMVTDDYNFLEMLSQHLARSGPFADFGIHNFGRYHWLSYGWTGLLNEFGGRPETFTTLTRVMPLVYSVALAGSLVQIAGYLNKTRNWSLALVPVWAILAINRLDWSGTSTAGVFAVVAAAAAAILLALDTTQGFMRRILLYTLFGVITVVTKLPSVFTVVIIIFCAEIFMLTQRFATRPRTLVLLLGCTIASFGIIPLISLASKIVGGFAITEVNLGLGQIATYGPGFAYLLVSLQRFLLIVPVVVMVILALSSGKRAACELPSILFLRGLAPIALLGVLMDTIMTGNANTFEYFSGSMYLVASLALIGVVASDVDVLSQAKKLRILSLIVICIVIFGYFWVRLSLAERLWRQIGTQLFEWDGVKVALLQYVTFDRRVGAAAVTMVILIATIRSKRLSSRLVLGSLLVSLSILTLYGYWNSAVSEFQRERQPAEIAANIGAPDFITVGKWLASNSKVSDLVATNYMLSANSGPSYSDYGLAALSEREYLVVGVFQKWFDPESLLHNGALNTVISFSDSPNSQLSEKLQKFGVRWIVIDHTLVERKNWEPFAVIAFQTEQLWVLKLQIP